MANDDDNFDADIFELMNAKPAPPKTEPREEEDAPDEDEAKVREVVANAEVPRRKRRTKAEIEADDRREAEVTREPAKQSKGGKKSAPPEEETQRPARGSIKPSHGSNNLVLGYAERIEARENEKRLAAEAVKEIYAEAKQNGIDGRILKQAIHEKNKDSAVRDEERRRLDEYLEALLARI